MICNKLTFNLISESSKGSEPAGAEISICWRLQDWELRMRCKIWAALMLWLGKSGWQGEDGINPGQEGNHLWDHPFPVSEVLAGLSRAGEEDFPLRDHLKEGDPPQGCSGIWFRAPLIPCLSRKVPWDVTGLGTNTQAGAEPCPAAENHNDPMLPPALPHAHAELMEDGQFNKEKTKIIFHSVSLSCAFYTELIHRPLHNPH